jgi:DNA-binding Xre family transcriptional regulator|tara:strand:+ start:549 stop:767 length:219 start_codon:yes stop_codon:yes gene_type:complete
MRLGMSTKKAMLEKGVSNPDLAKGLQVSDEFISKLRNDRLITIRVTFLFDLANYFDMTVSEFIKLGEVEVIV